MRRKNYKKNSKKRINVAETMVVAIDIATKTNTAIFRSPEGRDSMPFEFTNTKHGFDNFYYRLQWYKAKYNSRKVVVGFESTGVYAEPLTHYLQGKNIHLVMVNPVHTKRVKEIRDNSPNKTDEKDPRVIADLIQLGCFLSVITPKGPAAELRHLVHARERAIEVRNGLISMLFNILWKIFPEFTRVVKSLKGKTALYLLKNYTTPESIAAQDIDELADELRKISRGQFHRAKTEKLYRLAQNSVGIREGLSAIVKEIQHLINEMSAQNDFIEEIEKDISLMLEKIPYSKKIMSIKGIAEISTAGLIGEIANFEDFDNSAEIEKLAGLNLFEISSGKRKGQKRISKRGRSLLRKLLYFAALNVIKNDGIFREKYQEFLERGKPKNQALIAIARKLLRVVFALVRNNTDFDKEYETQQRLRQAA